MNHDLVVTSSVNIKASAAKVWEVLTEPAHIAKYLHGTETITDWKSGSPIVFQGEYDGKEYKDKGMVRESIPHQKIVYGYWSGFSGLEDVPENYATVTYLIEEVGKNEVKFTWKQEGFAGTEGLEHSKAGFGVMLNQIKALAEEGGFLKIPTF